MPDTHLADPSLLKFGIGQPVPRQEDPVLLRGQGRYTDDMALAGQAWCVMVRSPYAHGVIRGIGVDAARAMPGVLGVFTAADMTAYGPMRSVLPLKNRDGTPLINIERGPRAADRVRFTTCPATWCWISASATRRRWRPPSPPRRMSPR